MSDVSASERGIAGEDRLAAAAARLPALAAPAGAALLVGALGAANGGYYPTAWGWTALAAGWVAGVVAVARERLGVSRIEVAFVGLLGALAAWVLLSAVWSASVPRTVLEYERTVAYVVAVLAFVLAARRRSAAALLGGVAVGVALVCCYALTTRLLPERFPAPPQIAGHRLSEPLGYWNGLGCFAALGCLLALGFAARARTHAARAAAAAALVPVTLTLYFTFSRGAWIALALGFTAMLALDRRRLQLLAVTGVASAAPALAVALASREPALTRLDAITVDAANAGHRIAGFAVLLAAAGAAALVGLARLERRSRVPAGAQRVIGLGLAAAGAATAIVVVAAFGGPVEIARDARRSFEAPPPVVTGSLNERLFNFSGSGRSRQWGLARDAADERPSLGWGAGTYELYWNRHRDVPGKVRDAHSLYLETLAELGPLGLALLVGALLVPIVAVRRARREPLAAAAFGAYVAYLAHAGVDWDWELPALTLAALFCGGALLAAARIRPPRIPPLRARVAAAAVAGTAVLVGIVGVLGNGAMDDAARAIQGKRWAAAESASRRAMTWAPWAAEPWRRLGQSQVGRRRYDAGEANLRKAIAKDPENWELWFDLALATLGREQERALARAHALNPLSPEIGEFVRAVIDVPRKGS